MTNLQLFQRYSHAENVVTNNALLLLQRVYQHSPARFRRLMLALWDTGHEAPEFGLRFAQQLRGVSSVPDGVMVQESVKVVVETKLGDVFDADQVRRHFAELRAYNHRFALMLGTGEVDWRARQYSQLRSEAERHGIALAAVSFETLVAKVNELYGSHHEDMLALAQDFEAFCDSFGLLPRDKWTAFVPPCGQSLAHNLSEQLYYCPDDRPVRKTRYLGVYARKAVVAIGTIAKVVASPRIDLHAGTVESIEGESLAAEECARILRAAAAAESLGWNIVTGHTFFLCDAMEPTDYRKGSPGGIQNRRYLDLGKALPSFPADLATLAQQLRGAEAWK